MKLKKEDIKLLKKLNTLPIGYAPKTVVGYYIASVNGLDCEYIETKTSRGSKVRLKRNGEMLYQTCSICKLLLRADSYHKGQSYCKSCTKRNYEKHGKEKQRKRYTENKNNMLSQARKWQEENPIRVKVLAANNRGRKLGKGVIPLEQAQEVIDRFINHEEIECAYCTRKVALKPSEFHLDHFYALSLWGLNAVDNIVPTCKYCNHAKKDEDFFEWSKDYFSHNSILTPYQVQKRMVDYFKEYYDIDYSDRINVPAD